MPRIDRYLSVVMKNRYPSTNGIMYLLIFALIVNLVVQVSCRTSAKEREAEYFTNTWSVLISGGVEKAKEVAKKHGLEYVPEVSKGLPDIYLFRDHKLYKETNWSNDSTTETLYKDPQVKWVQQQVAENRVTRSFFSSLLSEGFGLNLPFSDNGFGFQTPSSEKINLAIPQRAGKSSLSWPGPAEAYSCLDSRNPNARPVYRSLNLNDEYWLRQYYIQDCRDNFDKPPSDLNLVPVWLKYHLFGNNIKVVVVDDGVETDHLDLIDNYDPSLGLDLQDDDRTPNPEHLGGRKFSHGTRCAGVIGMKGNNTICGIGIAPSVTLGAVRLLGPNPSTDYKDGKALLFKHTEVHVMSNSWGPNDDGKTMSYFGPQTRSALKTGVNKGRDGKGLIYIFACGNGKKDGDNCGCDPFVSTIYTIAVASCDHRGKITNYSERCASIMVTTYSGDRSTPYNVVTTDIGRLKTECTTEHTGTSASAPMVSGAVALALEANPQLTWREIQHLLAWTSQVAPLSQNKYTWIKNGAGFYVSHDFGFGLLNIKELVEKAQSFQRIPRMNTCVSKIPLDKNGTPFQSNLKIEVMADGCESSPSEVVYLEHVQLTISLAFPRRGNLQITLTSPSGTTARLLEPRPFDKYPFGIPVWTFDSILMWGESPKGNWIINITDKAAERTRSTSISNISGRTTSSSSEHNDNGARSPLDDVFKLFGSINQRAGCPVQRFGNGVKKFWSRLKNIREDIESDTDNVDSKKSGACIMRFVRKKIRKYWLKLKNIAKQLDDGAPSSGYSGEVKELNLIFHGTGGKQKPPHYAQGPRPYYKFSLPT